MEGPDNADDLLAAPAPAPAPASAPTPTADGPDNGDELPPPPSSSGDAGGLFGSTTAPAGDDGESKSNGAAAAATPPPAAAAASAPAASTGVEEDSGSQSVHDEPFAAEFQATVSQPETTGGMMKKVTTYLVRTEPAGYSVRRRYSDFDWLYQVLKARYVGMLIPSLPPKNALGVSTDLRVSGNVSNMRNMNIVSGGRDLFIKNRMRLLNIFMERIGAIPYLRSDSSISAFLQVQDPAGWEAAKKATGDTSLYEDSTVGCRRWRNSLAAFNYSATNAERQLLDMRRQADELERHMAQVANGAKQLGLRAQEWAAELGSFKQHWRDFRRVELDNGDASKVEYPNKDVNNLEPILTASCEAFDNWHQILEFQPEVLVLFLQALLTYESQQFAAFKVLLQEREAAIVNLQKTEVSLGKHQQELASGNAGKSGMFTLAGLRRGGASLDSVVQLEEKEVADLRRQVEMTSRALFYCEIDRFNSERRVILDLIMRQMSAAHFQFAKRLGIMWQGATSSMGLDMIEGMEAAKTVLAIAATDNEDALSVGSGRSRSTAGSFDDREEEK